MTAAAEGEAGGGEAAGVKVGGGEAGLVLEGLTLRLAGAPLFRPLSCRVPAGEVAAVTGPSGSGKSSLLLAIAGLLAPAFRVEGRVRLMGRELLGLPAERRGVGLIFQDPLLLPHLSVGQNLAFGLPRRVAGSRLARRARIEDALREIRMEGFAARDPQTLSGGQRARVALMRSLLAEPAAVLLDEPFVTLDPPLRREMRALLSDLLALRGLPALLVTHDAEDSDALANQTLSLICPPKGAFFD